MKIYFTSSITGLTQYRDICSQISNYLKEKDHKVYDDFLSIDKREDIAYTKSKSHFVYDYIVKHIKNSDIFIAEMSYRSAPVSYQLTYAIENNIPSLYLVDKKTGSLPHGVFRGNPSRYLIIKEYTKNNIEKILDEFLEKSKKLLMRRFNFILPAELDEYLGVASAIERISKGEYLRKIIEEKRDSDKRFQKIKSEF